MVSQRQQPQHKYQRSVSIRGSCLLIGDSIYELTRIYISTKVSLKSKPNQLTLFFYLFHYFKTGRQPSVTQAYAIGLQLCCTIIRTTADRHVSINLCLIVVFLKRICKQKAMAGARKRREESCLIACFHKKLKHPRNQSTLYASKPNSSTNSPIISSKSFVIPCLRIPMLFTRHACVVV